MTYELALGSCGWGTIIDEDRVFRLLDRFFELGGRIIDTADNYSFWDEGATGREAEEVIGRWLASRKPTDAVVATKVGAQPTGPKEDWPGNWEGLSAETVHSALAGSLERLGVDRVAALYAHIDDRSVPLEETLGALHEEVAAGRVERLGLSNFATWRIERARSIIAARGWTPVSWLQHRHSLIRRVPRGDLWEARFNDAGPELVDYLREHEELTLFTFSSMVFGAYAGRELPEAYRSSVTDRRLALVGEAAEKLGVTPSQVVLAWLLGGGVKTVPILGTTRLETLEENMAARELSLPDEVRAGLDAA